MERLALAFITKALSQSVIGREALVAQNLICAPSEWFGWSTASDMAEMKLVSSDSGANNDSIDMIQYLVVHAAPLSLKAPAPLV